MPVDTKALVAELTADLVARGFTSRRGLGVFVENMPALDPTALLQRLANPAEPPRIALLGLASKPRDIKGVQVTQDPSIANEWRNNKDARTRPTAVLVLGPAPKLNSLRSALHLVGPEDLRTAAVENALSRLDSPERRAFWSALARAPAISVDAILAFLELGRAAKSDSALMDLEPKSVHALGLLQHDALMTAGATVKARTALRRNLELVDRLRALSPRDKRTLAALDAEGTNDVVNRILKFSRSKAFDDLRGLTFDDVQEALRPQKKRQDNSPPKSSKAVMEGDALALEMILEETRGLGVAAKRFASEVAPDDEGDIDAEDINVGSRTVTPRIRNGTGQAVGAILGGLCDEQSWGGLITAESAPDVVSALRLAAAADVEKAPFHPHAENGVRDLLARATKAGHISKDGLAAWDKYAAVRARLLPHAVALTDHPLLALAGTDTVRELATELLETYSAALRKVHEAAEELNAVSKEGAKRLRARAVAADVIFVRLQEEICAVLAPTHPFHIWRWLTLYNVIKSNKDEMRELGTETLEPLVTDPQAVAPHLVLSTFAVDEPIEKTYSFIAAGNLGALPLFVEPGTRQAVRFRARGLAHIAERLLRVMPHASLGLRVLLVDPPSVAGALEFLLDLRSTIDGETPVPLHVTVARTRNIGEATDEEEEVLEALARDLNEARGTLRVAPPVKSLQDVAARMTSEPAHLCVVFEPGDSKDIRLGVTAPPLLSPLVLPRSYSYDAFDDRLDVVVAGNAPAFESYQDLFCDLTNTPRTDFLGRRSGASRVSRQLESLAHNSVWLTVVDQGLEPTFSVRGSNRIDARVDGGRDLITFTAHTEVLDDLVEDAIRQVGLRPNDETVKRAARELLSLSGEALLWLARQKVSIDAADPRVAKGLLGVLATVRWYLQLHPDALVVSLDDPNSRRWILGAGLDDRHGDLLFLRPEAKGVVVEAIEVKAYDEEAAAVTVAGGHISGRAATQIDQTLTVLKRITATNISSMVDIARQSVLRDQLYRAVAGRPYDKDKRERFVNLLASLFRDGAAELSGVVVKVQIQSGAAQQAPSAPKYAKSDAGYHVGYAELFETELGKVASKPTAETEASPRSPAVSSRADAASKPRPPRADKATTGASGGPSAAAAAIRSSDEAPRTPPSAQATPTTTSVLIGSAPDGTPVSWHPGRPDNPLNNFGLLVTGDSGSGKTQVLRAVIAELVHAGLPVCIFDFKNDYSSSDFADPLALRVHNVDARGLPFNPLALLPDGEGIAQPIRLIHEVVGIMKRIFGLGEQQEARLRQGMQSAFEAAGIDVKARSKVASLPIAPSFNDVFDLLKEDKRNEALLNRLSPLFDLDLFPSSEAGNLPFEQLLKERMVLDLHALPNDEIKAALAEFLIVRIHTYMLKGAQPRELKRLLVLDEAWRVAQSERLEELAREGRAFGVGIAIGTQFPGDLPDVLAGSLATQLLLQNSDPDHRKVVARTLSGASSGPGAQQVIRQIDRLRKHEGFFRNQHYTPYTLVETLPHYKRIVGTPLKK